MDDLTILLPTKNERAGLKSVLLEIAMLDKRPEILVVDTDSTDGTLEVARDFGTEIVRESRRGKGLAVITGLKHVATKYVIIIDADGTYPVEYLPLVYEELKKGTNAVFGERRYREKGSMKYYHIFGNYLLSLFASLLYWKRVKDVCTGMKGFETQAALMLDLSEGGFGIESQIFAKVCKNRLTLKEVPIRYKIRKGSSKLSSISGFLDLVWVLVKERF